MNDLILTFEEQINLMEGQISNFDTLLEKVMYIDVFFRHDPMFTKKALDIVIGNLARDL
jgi:hypothetical protein